MTFRCAVTIRSDTRYLSVLRDWVRAACEIGAAGSLPREAVFAASIALVEAVDNAIIHAHGRRREMPIGVTLSVRSAALVIEVVDRGRGMDHLAISEPAVLASRGRGLFMIGRVMGRVKSSVRGGVHRLRMELRR